MSGSSILEAVKKDPDRARGGSFGDLPGAFDGGPPERPEPGRSRKPLLAVVLGGILVGAAAALLWPSAEEPESLLTDKALDAARSGPAEIAEPQIAEPQIADAEPARVQPEAVARSEAAATTAKRDKGASPARPAAPPPPPSDPDGTPRVALVDPAEVAPPMPPRQGRPDRRADQPRPGQHVPTPAARVASDARRGEGYRPSAPADEPPTLAESAPTADGAMPLQPRPVAAAPADAPADAPEVAVVEPAPVGGAADSRQLAMAERQAGAGHPTRNIATADLPPLRGAAAVRAQRPAPAAAQVGDEPAEADEAVSVFSPLGSKTRPHWAPAPAYDHLKELRDRVEAEVAAEQRGEPSTPPAAPPSRPASVTGPAGPKAGPAPPPAAPARPGVVLQEPPAGAPGLKLMFIVWDRDAEARLASVKVESEGNTVIVHEGGVVGGMRVASIHPEAVDFSWNNRTFRVYTNRF
jgi:hypothetical protein